MLLSASVGLLSFAWPMGFTFGPDGSTCAQGRLDLGQYGSTVGQGTYTGLLCGRAGLKLRLPGWVGLFGQDRLLSTRSTLWVYFCILNVGNASTRCHHRSLESNRRPW